MPRLRRWRSYRLMTPCIDFVDRRGLPYTETRLDASRMKPIARSCKIGRRVKQRLTERQQGKPNIGDVGHLGRPSCGRADSFHRIDGVLASRTELQNTFTHSTRLAGAI